LYCLLISPATEELVVWDAVSKVDEEVAKGRLRTALQEINELPLDEMDWSPNSVSLRELPRQVEKPDVNEYDAMDLDD
jgi:hypothetical protein